MHRLAEVVPTKPRRRIQRARRRGATPPAARLDLRASMRAAGDPFERHWREPGERPRQAWLVCDVSGSVEPYGRMLLAYMQARVAAGRRVEAFVFGTRLRRVTAELRGRDPARRARARSGGTTIGEALATLNREHGRRVGRGAVVVLLSDGRHRGDPGQLEREVARLARCSDRLIWVDPLHAHGMQDGGPARRGRVHGRQLVRLAGGARRPDPRGGRVIGGIVLAVGGWRPSGSRTSPAARCSSTRSGP